MGLSLEEKARRYGLVRNELQKRGLAGLLIFSNAQINQQGFVRYFTDLPIPIYAHSILFLPDDGPYLFTPSPLQTYWAKKRSWIPADRIKLSRDAGHEMGTLITGMKKENATFGVINFDTMCAKDYKALMMLCPNLQLVDGTPLLEDVRRQKSAEELCLVRLSADIAVLSQRVVQQEMKKGCSEEELCAKVEEVVRDHGAERTFYLVSSSPGGFYPYAPGPQRLDGTSPVLFSTEVSGPGGYWTQIVRTFFWTKPEGRLMDMYRALTDIMDMAQRELRVGQKIADVAEKMRTIIHERGFEYGVHFGHGLGLDVVEEPLINTMNELVLLPGQIVTVHPHVIDEKESIGIWMGDTYLIGENQTVNLTAYLPQDF